MSSNITIITVGSRGDVQPYVALGRAIARAGHAVTIATHETFRTFVTTRGLQFAPVAGDPRGILGAANADRWLGTGRHRHLLAATRDVLGEVRPLIDAMLADFWRVSEGADLLIYSVVAAPCQHVAVARRVPSIAAFLQPMHRTGAHPMLRVPQSLRLGARVNRSTYAAVEWLVWRLFRTQLNAWRTQTLGLAPLAAPGPVVPAMYGFSPTVVARPDDWHPDVAVTGYWVLGPDDGWQPPAALTDFLAAGPPPVAIGFGSMTPQSAERLTTLALDALARTGQRGILLGGWGALGAGSLPDTVLSIDECPHEWLFPRTMAVVHHGGAGTTGAALRGGTPSIVVPLGFDQPYWAGRVAALGAGPPPISRRRVTAPWLAAAITRAADDQAMRARAAAIGEVLRAERGADLATAIIARLVAGRRAV
jgi:UDP:flavonoid glycosyltransferase YjiC (YdhE family)